jgi:hypothetical protein
MMGKGLGLRVLPTYLAVASGAFSQRFLPKFGTIGQNWRLKTLEKGVDDRER